MSSVDSITITSVSTVNQIEITSTSGITVTTVGTQGLAGPSAIMQKGVDATTIGSSGNGTFLVYDHANTQWTSSGSASVSNLTVEIQKLRIGGTGATVVSILDEDNMSSNSATSLATQQSIKAYVESRVGIDNLAALLASGNTTGGTNIVVSANDDITFTDTSKGLFGNSSDLQIYHDGTNSYIANSQGALKVATETSGITVNIGHTTSTVAIGDDLTVAGNQSITGTLGVTGTITGSLTGNVTGQVSDISNFTTANITENTNLYYTNERVDDQVNSLLVGGTGITLTYDDTAGTLTIDGQIGDITSVVAGDGLSGGGSSGDVTLTVNVDNSSVEINSDTLRVKASGITNDMLAGSITNSKLANADFTINSNSLVLGNSLTLDTDDIGEGTNNQYYTTSRANSDFDTRLATKTTDNLTEGSSRLYFTTARANTAIDNRVTKSFVDNLGVEASSVTANSVALGTDTTGNYIQTISGTANKITVSGSGSESADVTLTLPDDVQIADSLTVAGNLTVNGTLTSLDTTNLDIEDNLFQLNAGLTGSPVNDSGMLINRGNQNNGIFMWDESVDKFTMGLTTANGSATGNITLASLGTLVVNVEGNLTGAVTGNSSTATTLQTPRSIALSGDVSASAVNFDGSGNITLTTTIEANSIALGTDTVGNYVASITGGTGVTITGGTGESSTPSVAIGQSVGTTDDVTFNQVTADIIGNIEGATEFAASAGEALSKGDAVYISGVSGNKPVVSKADSDDANKMPSFGLAKTDANLNANVSVVTFGTLAGLNTSSFSVGDTLYISTTAGGLTASAPTGESSLIQNIGKVQRSHASAGSIKVGGAGRTNATPNLNDGKIFLGNGSNQSVSTTLDSSVVPENTNLYYTDARVQAVSINNVVEDTTPQLGGNLASNGNDILFADNDKAVFGAGSDLQIYHDGTDSFVADAGTGRLILRGSSQVRLETATGTQMISADDGGAAKLYHNGIKKLDTTSTGIDVTGIVEATGYLAVEGTSNTGSAGDRWIGGDGTAGTWFYNVPTGSNHYFGVNNSNKLAINSSGIDVTGTATMDGLTVDGNPVITNLSPQLFLQTGNGNNNFQIAAQESVNNAFEISSGGTGINAPSDTYTKRLVVQNNGDISFYEDTGTTAKFFWDASAESLGIGTSSPNAAEFSATPNGVLEVEGTKPVVYLSETDTTDAHAWLGVSNGVTYLGSTGSGLQIRTGTDSASTKVTVDTSGNVGIGDSSPATKLEILDANGVGLRFGDIASTPSSQTAGYIGMSTSAYSGNNGDLVLIPRTSSTSNILLMEGNVGIGTSSPVSATGYTVLTLNNATNGGNIVFQSNGTAKGYVYNSSSQFRIEAGASTPMVFANPNGEAMRIDNNKNLLVGTTTIIPSNSSTEEGISLAAGSYGGFLSVSRDGGTAAAFNRMSSDGQILDFRKDGSSVGSIFVSGDDMGLGTGNVGIRFLDSGQDRIIPRETDNTSADAAIDLGDSSSRFRNLYLSGGVRLGGTGSANELDDYEEGTWTPVIQGGTTAGTGTYTTQSGTYRKVGSLVHITCRISITNHTGTGYINLGGIPFSGGSGNETAFHVMHNILNIDTGKQVSFHLGGGTAGSLFQSGDSVSWATIPMDTAFSLILNGTYTSS